MNITHEEAKEIWDRLPLDHRNVTGMRWAGDDVAGVFSAVPPPGEKS